MLLKTITNPIRTSLKHAYSLNLNYLGINFGSEFIECSAVFDCDRRSIHGGRRNYIGL